LTGSIKLKENLDKLIIFFIGISVISSQISIAMSSIGVVGLIVLFIFKLIIEENFSFQEKTLLYLLIFFSVWQIITSFISNDPQMAITGSLKKMSLYFVIICSIYMINNRKQILRLLVILFIFTSLLSLFESIWYLYDFYNQTSIDLAEFRLSYFGSPITLAEIKMLILLLMVPFMLSYEKPIINRWLLAAMSLHVFLSLYFTNSRNAMLGLFAGLVIIGIIKHRYFLITCIFVVIIFFYTAPYPIKARVSSIIELNHPSNKARFVMWETAIKMIKDKPITGYGDSDILSFYKKYKIPEYHAEGSHMHNNIFHIAVLYGIIGLILWLSLMIYIFFRQIKAYIKHKNDNFLNVLLLSSISCMVAFQVSGLTEWNFGDAEFIVLMWFILSFPFITNKISGDAAK